MSKAKQQGTAHETSIVKQANRWGLPAARLPEGGSKDLGDVIIGNADMYSPPIVALWWKRLVKTGKQKRQPDGEPEVVVLRAADFLTLLQASGVGAIVEAKATERLNVTRVLANARKKAGA